MIKTFKLFVLFFALLQINFCFSQSQTKTNSTLNLIKKQLQQAPYKLSANDLNSMYIDQEYLAKKTNITHVYIGQKLQGIKIHNAISSFAIKDNKIAYVGESFVKNAMEKANSFIPVITPKQAVNKMALHFDLGASNGLITEHSEAFQHVFSNANLTRENIPVNLVFAQTENNQLKLSWDVTISTLDTKHVWNAKVDALTGEIHAFRDMQISCNFDLHAITPRKITSYKKDSNTNFNLFKTNEKTMRNPDSYMVFPLPVESPNHGPRQIVTNPADAIASPFGWHDINGAPGAEYTITRGNNVYAQEDANGNNGFGTAPDGGASLDFNFPYDGSLEPISNQDAAIVNLFYLNNIMHDVWYQYGFDEPSGNFQENNYGNGGAGGDFVIADAQDGAGTNNANFSSATDGINGRMQMYLWNTGGSGFTTLDVNSPAGIAGSYGVSAGQFGPNTYNVTGNLVVVDDGTANGSEGCGALTNAAAINGNIAVIDRGNCEFGLKALNAQNAGAIAVIVINNVPGGTINMGAGANGAAVTIPSVMVSQADGAAIKAELPGVNVTIESVALPSQVDGDFDNGIVAHEYGHGISTRITGGPNASCLGNEEQMGEGWSDWFGLMLTIEPGDTSVDPRGIGTYAGSEPTTGGGIRSYQYSTDMTVNPHTYDDIKTEAVPHGVGSVWSAMIWDLAWKLIDMEGYDTDLYNGTGGNNIAMHLVTQGLKLQPCSPGFIDGRDAILAADELLYNGAYKCVIWEVFARRGLGYSADQGASTSRSDGTEAFDVPPGLFINNTSSLNEVPEEEIVTFTVELENCSADTNVNITSTFANNTLEYVNGSATNGGSYASNVVMYPQIDNLAANSSLSYSYQAAVKAGTYFAPMALFQDNMDATTNWTESGSGPNAWAITNSTACGSSSYFINNIATDSERIITLNPITPNGVISLSFDHYFDTEVNWDGGLVEISNDGGSTWTDLGPYFDTNGYNDYIHNNTGEPAFSGNSGGCITSTTVPLTAFLGTLQVRFRFLTDAAVDGDGWYIDAVNITDHAAAIIESMAQGDNESTSSKHAVLITEALSVPDTEIVGLNMYPNPTDSYLYIESQQSLSEAKIVLYDIMGRALTQNMSRTSMSDTKIGLDISHLATGTYFITVASNGLKSTKKIIKK
ncbi:MAG: T9SS-dependent M36 family metallopeptidase [Oceanihabitans sp.]